MKKLLVFSLLVVVALVGTVVAKDIILKVKVSAANVRTEPDLSAPVIAQVKSGTLLEAKSKVDSWYEIQVQDKSGDTVTGYIHANVVDVVSGEAAPAPQEVRPVERAPAQPVRQAPRYARTQPRSDVKKFRIMGGLAFANQRLDDDSQDAIDAYDLDKSSLMGFTLGFGYEAFSLTDNICLEVGGFFVPGGMKFSGEFQDVDIKVKAHGYAVGLALVGKYKLSPVGATPYALAGIDVGYVLSMKMKTEAGEEEDEEDILDDTNRLYYGLDFGIGYEMELKGLTLVIEGRYLLGLSNMLKKPDDHEGDWDSYAKPTTMAVTLGIRL
ncbi:MAG: outer membrane beta-barrel protein [Candidatus Aminicenantes bacterium]|nr:outer membrane beta-barrel protein [Candidatus Aminicenantes bacterium]